MSAKIIDGKLISKKILEEIKIEFEIFKKKKNIIPGIALILIGNNPASQIYVYSKAKICNELGFHSAIERVDEKISESDLLNIINKFNSNKSIHGILVQLPLPKHIDENKIIEAIDYKKDVDGFHPINVGKLVLGQKCFIPCTPLGIYELLLRYQIETSGKHIVIIGRSNIVGKPIANLLLQKNSGNATVTIIHTGTKNISSFTKEANILIAAIGKQNFVTKEMVKENCVVIDVGINRTTDKKIVGDVDFENVKEIVSAITPVPGGVGPMTIAMLVKNTFSAAFENEKF